MDTEKTSLLPTLEPLKTIHSQEYSLHSVSSHLPQLQTALSKYRPGSKEKEEYVLILALWTSLSHHRGAPLDLLVETVGVNHFTAILQSLGECKLSSYSDNQLQQIFTFLNLGLLHSHLDVFTQWAKRVYLSGYLD